MNGHEPLRPVRPLATLDRGVFTFTLDFELAWGTRGRRAARRVAPFLDGTRGAIHGLLQLFERYEISATWAIVGALLLASRNGRERHPWIRDKLFADVPPGDSASQPFWYAEDVLPWLLEHPVRQELACQTLTHILVDHRHAGRETLRTELRLFRELFGELSLDQPTAFIFPKAKMGHFDVLAEEGFRCFRGPESEWFESLPGELLPAACRFVDANLACRPHVGEPKHVPQGLWMIPASQFYSPFMSVGKRVSVQARVRKALKGLRLAAHAGRVYHLWTHPFNLGVRTLDLLAGLEEILREARRLAERGELEILTMGQIAARLDGRAVTPGNGESAIENRRASSIGNR